MIGEGVELMFIGMGVVFSFLILMVVILNMTGAFFQKYASRFAVPEPAPKTEGGGPARPAGDASAKVAVAVAAAYRARKGA